MNSNKGIFEGFPAAGGGAGQAFPSPFAAVAEDQPGRNPFAPVEPPAPFSPFSAADGEVARPLPEPGKPARLPERRRGPGENPFQVAEPSEGFGFDPPAGGFAAAPFQAPAASPFSVVPEEPAVTLQAVPMVQAYQPPVAPPPQAAPAVSPFQVAQAPAPAVEVPQAPPPVEAAPVAQVFAPAPQAAVTAAQVFQPPAAAPMTQQAPAPAPAPVPAIDPAFAAWAPLAAAAASVAAPAPVAAPPPMVAPASGNSLPEPSSTGIRQLELRAIFGVERELSVDEILQRLRGLAGIRSLQRVGHEELAAFENLRRCLGPLAPGGAPMRLMFGNSPVELVREGRVVLAVVTDGSFAPGVRETIMIGARELDRML